jgi:hypothetical protein
MVLWISGSKQHNNWHLAQHTYFSESFLLTSSIPGQLPGASFLSLMLAISYGTWNSNSPVPLHGPWHIKHTYLSNSSTYWHSPHAEYSLLQEKTFSKLPDTLHNYHMPWYMPLFHSTTILVNREVQECPGFPLSLWNSCCPSSPEKAWYLTCTSTTIKKALHQVLQHFMLLQWSELLHNSSKRNPLMKIRYNNGTEFNKASRSIIIIIIIIFQTYV